MISKTNGKVQIMNDANRHYIGCIGKRAHLLQEIYLMFDVEKSKRLIKKQIPSSRRRRRNIFGLRR